MHAPTPGSEQCSRRARSRRWRWWAAASASRCACVTEATGRSRGGRHKGGMPALLAPQRTVRLFLTPDRKALNARIDARFGAMLAAGALAEVRVLAARKLDPLLPAMKAH